MAKSFQALPMAYAIKYFFGWARNMISGCVIIRSCLDVLIIFLLRLLSFHYVEPPDGAYGGFVNGSWNGLVGMAIRRVCNRKYLLIIILLSIIKQITLVYYIIRKST